MADDTKDTQATQFDVSESTGYQRQQGDALKGSERQGKQQAESKGGNQHGGDQGRGAVQQRGGSMAARNPYAMMQQLSAEMDRMFESFFYGRPMQPHRGMSSVAELWSPEMEISTQGNELRVCVDLPGVSKDSVKVDVHEGMLSIQGERREERNEGGEGNVHRTERRYGSFYRAVALPENASIDQAKAQMKDGVLEITIPMSSEQQKGRSLQIEG